MFKGTWEVVVMKEHGSARKSVQVCLNNQTPEDKAKLTQDDITLHVRAGNDTMQERKAVANKLVEALSKVTTK